MLDVRCHEQAPIGGKIAVSGVGRSATPIGAEQVVAEIAKQSSVHVALRGRRSGRHPTFAIVLLGRIGDTNSADAIQRRTQCVTDRMSSCGAHDFINPVS